MASIASDPNGRKRILFLGLDRTRKAIRLGKASMRQAEAFKVKVEQLVSAKITGAMDERVIHKAGLKSWPKLFQNLRATRETELAEQWPEHVVCAWIGNSRMVARKHYLQVTEEHFQQAAQKAAQQPAEMPRTQSQPDRREPERVPDLQHIAAPCGMVHECSVGDTGFEHAGKPPGKPHLSQRRGAYSGAPGTDFTSGPLQVPPDLAVVIDSWPELPEAVRAGIAAMVKAAKPKGKANGDCFAGK